MSCVLDIPPPGVRRYLIAWYRHPLHSGPGSCEARVSPLDTPAMSSLAGRACYLRVARHEAVFSISQGPGFSRTTASSPCVRVDMPTGRIEFRDLPEMGDARSPLILRPGGLFSSSTTAAVRSGFAPHLRIVGSGLWWGPIGLEIHICGGECLARYQVPRHAGTLLRPFGRSAHVYTLGSQPATPQAMPASDAPGETEEDSDSAVTFDESGLLLVDDCAAERVARMFGMDVHSVEHMLIVLTGFEMRRLKGRSRVLKTLLGAGILSSAAILIGARYAASAYLQK